MSASVVGRGRRLSIQIDPSLQAKKRQIFSTREARTSYVRIVSHLTLVASRSGLVRRSSGTSSCVSRTKNASPASPIFMLKGIGSPLTSTLTYMTDGEEKQIRCTKFELKSQRSDQCQGTTPNTENTVRSANVDKKGVIWTLLHTFLSPGRNACHFPKRTWKGLHASSVSPRCSSDSRSMTITSIAPVRVEGFIGGREV
jgi:hypothetical protein